MSTCKKSVLVAEDNPVLANVLRFNLQRIELNVTVANDGASAWGLAQRQQFDAVITDQEMPGLTGLELCQRIRGLSEYDDVPILMVTAREIELDAENLKRELGIAAVFAKPYSPNKLVRTVEDLLATTS